MSDNEAKISPLAGSTTPLKWHPVVPPFRLAGFPWYETDGLYRRLPKSPAQKLPPGVDNIANCTAGGQVAFKSDSRRVAVRVELAGPADMNHMPSTGQCGFDLYIGPPRARRFHNTAKYDHRQAAYEVLLFEHPAGRPREFLLNFPLYQGVKKVRIGLDPEARVAPPAPWSRKGRIVMYGTSIVQGGCAARPGMAHANIISRALNVEVVNLGFSGNARGEPEVIRTLAAVPNPALFVLDYEANTNSRELTVTLPEALLILRQSHRRVPILVVSRIPFAADLTHADIRRERVRCRNVQARAVEAARKSGDTRVRFLDGARLLGRDFEECTVDGVHPTDLGFMRMAQELTRTIRRILA